MVSLGGYGEGRTVMIYKDGMSRSECPAGFGRTGQSHAFLSKALLDKRTTVGLKGSNQ